MLEDIMEETELTQQEFDALLVYNTTIPTGKIIGKKWRRDWNGLHYLCEYEKYINDGKDIQIKTTRIQICKENERI